MNAREDWLAEHQQLIEDLEFAVLGFAITHNIELCLKAEADLREHAKLAVTVFSCREPKRSGDVENFMRAYG